MKELSNTNGLLQASEPVAIVNPQLLTSVLHYLPTYFTHELNRAIESFIWWCGFLY